MFLGAFCATGLSLDWFVRAAYAESIFLLALASLGGTFPAVLLFLFCGEGCPPSFRGRLSNASSRAWLWPDGHGIDAWFIGFALGDVSHGETALKWYFAVSCRIRGCGWGSAGWCAGFSVFRVTATVVGRLGWDECEFEGITYCMCLQHERRKRHGDDAWVVDGRRVLLSDE